MAKNRELVMLADTYNPDKHNINGWFMSEKLDGQRAIWLPETRGYNVNEILFSNTAKDKRPHVCTGLWSRYAKVIHAPDWWLDQLPKHPLDGELYIRRGAFQLLESTVRKLPENRVEWEWKNVKYHAFDVPTYSAFFTQGKVNNANYKTDFRWKCPYQDRTELCDSLTDFMRVYHYLTLSYGELPDDHVLKIVKQHILPYNTDLALDMAERLYNEVISEGGEGLIIRHYGQLWEPYRVKRMVKMKPTNDDEGVIVGFTAGKGRLNGMLGALIVRWKDKVFKIAGLTDFERTLRAPWNQMVAEEKYSHPDEKIDFSPTFTIGQTITFEYRELTDNGTPKDARYKRHRDTI